MLGDALIKAHKQAFKGGYFKLYFFIKEALKEYKGLLEFKSKLEIFENPLKFHQFSTQSLEFIFANLEKMNAWLNSKQFQKEFADFQRKPLINPENFDYKSVCSICAYELNLPLPPLYDLILISSSRCGHNAILNFFEECGAKRARDHLPKDLRVNYTHFYEFLLENENAFKIIPFMQYANYNYTPQEFQSFCEFFTHKAPCLVQVRDPFIRLLLVNNRWFNGISPSFNLKDDLSLILDRMFYVFDGKNCLENGLNALCSLEMLRTGSALRGLKFISEFHFVDTDQELFPDNAFETMKKLSLKYGLKAPKDKEFFEGLIEENLWGLIPVSLTLNYQDAFVYLNKQDLQKLPKYRNSYNKEKFKAELLITAYQFMKISKNKDDFVDLSLEIFGEKRWFYDGSDIRVYMKKSEYENYFDELLLEAAQKKFKEFQKELVKRVQIEKAKRFSVEEILHYLSENPALSLKLKAILDKEFECVKNSRPDIMEKWEHYKKFEANLAKLKEKL